MAGFFENLRNFFGGGSTPNPPPNDSEGDFVDDWVHSGTWLHTASSNVEAIRYLYDDKILEVEFKNGSYYQYFDVPPDVARGMYLTDSPGRFVWRQLRDVFNYGKITSVSMPKRRGSTVVRPRNDIKNTTGIQSGIVPDWNRH
jgi:hypothetical protein